MSATDQRFFGHPRGLGVIVFTEMWERFSFYGMQALLMLYMVKHLLISGNAAQVWGFTGFRAVIESIFGRLTDQAFASQTFGLYVALVYFLPIFGGLAGDRVLGQRRAVILGALCMAAGHFLMAFEAAFLLALLCLIVGSGLLKGNLMAQVGSLYAKSDSRRDSAFTMYTISITTGAFLGPLICGALGEKLSWHYGFAAAGIGMLLGLAIYLAGGSALPRDLRAQRARVQLEAADWRPIIALIVMFLINTLYWIAQTQVWNTYPLWIEARVSRQLLGWQVPVTWFQALDALAVVMLAPLIMGLWRRQAQRATEPLDLTKIAIGCAVFAGACFELVAAEYLAGSARINVLWPILFHFICAVGYLYAFPVALALFSRAAPAAVNGMMAGVCYLSLFAGSIISGFLGRFYEIMSPGRFWLMHGLIVASATLLLLLLRAPLNSALDSKSRPRTAAAPNAMGAQT